MDSRGLRIWTRRRIDGEDHRKSSAFGPLNLDAGSIPAPQALRSPPEPRQVDMQGPHFYM